ncbi:hypothetical protein Lfee_1390 [Legionella feeleii]|uniref:Uncharacterized protein n=1 Tax=Legionella feeleii TaxID=453 RepID=A0A0W0TUY7_9GAMM|nr:hypothetical protein Lfee_1390 [Legionella feeleii]
MRINWILSILFCRKILRSSESGLFFLLQLILFLEFCVFLSHYLPFDILYERLFLFIVLLILFNLILLACFKTHSFFSYNNSFLISLWIYTFIIVIEQLLLMLVSPYLVSEKVVYLWAVYFLIYSLFAYLWGFMMFINILTFFISKK